MNLEPEFDTVEQEFRELERRVRQRNCRHDSLIDVTTLGGPGREQMCADCGKRFTQEAR